jgi:hypothetical protein
MKRFWVLLFAILFLFGCAGMNVYEFKKVDVPPGYAKEGEEKYEAPFITPPPGEPGDVFRIEDLTAAGAANKIRAFTAYMDNNDASCEADDDPWTIPADDCATCSNKGQWEAMTGFGFGPTSAPQTTWRDSDATDYDDNVYFRIDCDDVTSNDEDCAIYFYAQDSTGGAAVLHGVLPRDGNEGPGYLDFMEDRDNGDNYARIIAPSALGGDRTLTLPDMTRTIGVQFKSLQVSDLGDSTTPSVLTDEETTNTVISNYKSSGADHVFTMPDCHVNGNLIFPIGDEFQVDVEPDTGDLFYLNGTAMAVNEHIQNTADTLGDRMVGYCVNINGTLRWMFYGDSNWVEETP